MPGATRAVNTSANPSIRRNASRKNELGSTELTSPLPSSEKVTGLAWRSRQLGVHVPTRARNTNPEVCKKFSAAARPRGREQLGETPDNQMWSAHRLDGRFRARCERTARSVLRRERASDVPHPHERSSSKYLSRRRQFPQPRAVAAGCEQFPPARCTCAAPERGLPGGIETSCPNVAGNS